MYNTGNSSKNITTTSIVDGTISNADVDGSAAIATSKLSGAVTSITSHGLASSATTDTTNASNIGSGTLSNSRLSLDISNSDVNASAAIAQSKLATLAITDSEVANDALSGDKIDGGTISAFASTGIDDNATGTKLTLSDTSADFTVEVAATDGAKLRAYRGGDSAYAALYMDTGETLHIFNSYGSKKIQLKREGNVILPTTISFNGDTAAANALDDYEEGTWTPTVNGSTAGTIAYTYQDCKYTKVGGLVHASGRVATSSIGSAAGAMTLFGLPFSANISTLHAGYATGLAIPSGSTISAYVSGTTATMQLWDSTGGVSGLQMSEWSDNGYMMFSITYTVT